MNIAIIGNSHFGLILAKQLSKFDMNNNYKFYNTNEKKIDKIKFILDIFKIDVVYSISASISGGRALNLALKFNKKIAQHFIGSDVLSAIEDYKNRNINKKLVEKSKYFCVSSWLQKELNTINIQADLLAHLVLEKVNFKSSNNKEKKTIKVLSYINKTNPEFYGMSYLIKLARYFPDIEFRIAGIDEYSNISNNIKMLGWVDMNEEYKQADIFIRATRHDGMPFSVIEALSYGCIVFFNNKIPYIKYFKNSDDLIKKISEQKKLFDSGKLEINQKAIDFVKKEFAKEKVLGNLVKILTGKL